MNSKEQHNLEQAVAEIEGRLPFIAESYFIYYRTLISKGFTKEEALYLVGIHGTSFGVKEVK